METQPQYVGVDLHRRRSVIVRKDAAGELLETVQIDNDPLVLAEVIERAGEAPEVVLEATLWLVLGGGRARRVRRQRASGAPVGQQLGKPASQKR